jgi:hypothetical protein
VPPDPSPAMSSLLRQGASDLFLAGFPLLVMDAVRRLHPVGANRMFRLPHDCACIAPGLADEDGTIVATSAWIDLKGGPVIVRLPDERDRLLTLTLVDTAAAPIASFGSRTGHAGGADLALVGPAWRGELSGGLTALRTTSDQVWAITRLAALSVGDVKAAEDLLERQRLLPPMPSSPGGPAEAIPGLSAPASDCLREVANIEPATLLHRIVALADRAPLRRRQAIRSAVTSSMELLDLPADTERWSPNTSQTLRRGFGDAYNAIREAAQGGGAPTRDAWRVARPPEPLAAGHLAEAARVYGSLGAPIPADLLSLVCGVDESGRAFSGAECYRIRFACDAAPPVAGYWSLTSTPGAPIPCALGSRSGLARNRDGSLDIVFQSSEPDRAPLSNWLPVHAGPFTLSMRLHWPKAAALSGAWRMPPVERLGSGRTRRRGWAGSSPGGAVSKFSTPANPPPNHLLT